MIGCASFSGVDIKNFAEKILFLRENYSLPKELEIKSLQENLFINSKNNDFSKKALFSDLPPLIKGYLRAGAKISQDYFVDYDFNTIDVCVLVFTENINYKYKKKFLH